MSLSNTVEAIKRRLRPDDTLIEKLKILSEDIANVSDIKGLVCHPGWSKLRQAIEGQIMQAESDRFKLDADPTKNHKEIVAAREFQRALSLILFTIDGTLARESELLKLERDYLELMKAAEIKARDFQFPEFLEPNREK